MSQNRPREFNFTKQSQGRVAPAPGIYLVTDPGQSMARIGKPARAESTDHAWHDRAIAETLATIEGAVNAGVSTVQFRWKNVDAGYLLDLVMAGAKVIDGRAQIIVNDRVDVFLAAQQAGANLTGVHIGQTDLPPKLVRDLVGDAQIGWSAASPAEMARANALGDVIDCVGVGSVHVTHSKDDAPEPLGTAGIADIAAHSRHPIIAIGGITKADIEPLASTDIHSTAVISAIVSANDPAAAARDLVKIWNETKSSILHQENKGSDLK